MDFAGASPDGLVLPGAIEIKVPKPETHLRWRDAGVVPPEHEPQCVGVIDACDLEWIDFVSFCPTPMPEELQLFVVRLYRDQKRVDEIQAEMRSFNAEIESTIARLQGGVTQQLRASLEVV
jgi:hypothetical protein